MSLAKFAALLGGKGAKIGEKIGGGIASGRAGGQVAAAMARRNPKKTLAAGGLGAAGLASILGGEDELELSDIEDLESAGDYGSQALRKLIAKLGLED